MLVAFTKFPAASVARAGNGVCPSRFRAQPVRPQLHGSRSQATAGDDDVGSFAFCSSLFSPITLTEANPDKKSAAEIMATGFKDLP